MSSPVRHTRAVGRKFHSDGSVRVFPGNTVICFVDSRVHASVYAACLRARDALMGMSCGAKLAFLPPESYHMTVFGLLCDEDRAPRSWSRLIPRDASIDEADRFMLTAFAGLKTPPPFRMRYAGMQEPTSAIELEPADLETERSLRGYRDAISRATGVRAADHDTYRFHISLAYKLAVLDEPEASEVAAAYAAIDTYMKGAFGVFETAPPQLTFFEDMFEFVRADERGRLASRAKR
jgi:hypothetical protein